jgi:non-lysosomal glucosylceramidase
MIYRGMVAKGVECVDNIRRRYDGKFRNPWDEAECGHHYARAMAAWSGVLALSGFLYDAPRLSLRVTPRAQHSFQCIWSAASAWGTFLYGTAFALKIEHGALGLREVLLPARAGSSQPRKVTLAGRGLKFRARRNDASLWQVELTEDVQAHAGETLAIA